MRNYSVQDNISQRNITHSGALIKFYKKNLISRNPDRWKFKLFHTYFTYLIKYTITRIDFSYDFSAENYQLTNP
jgi:hypothetical protein